MSDIRDFCPLWGEWEVELKIGEGSFGTVWKIKRNVLGGKVYYAAVKHISIPKDKSEIDRLFGEGVFSDEQSANHYYDHMLQSIADEIDAMHKLQGYTNIVAYEDHKIIPKDNSVGYDLFLRMELLKPLTERIQQGMRIHDVTALGKDVATAISVLCDHHMIHRDIKPQNIFINDRGIYKLGDYGTARALGTGATAMSRKGTYNYMSPEIYNNQKADIRADIYSLGLVLYRLLNGNRLPFLPIGERITSEDSDAAVMRRISGEKIDPPKYADNELSDIVLKACAFDPDDRYRSPEDMISDLDKYRTNNNDHIQSNDQDKTIYDSHVYSFGKLNKNTDISTNAEEKHSSQHELAQVKTNTNTDEETVVELESVTISNPTVLNNTTQTIKKTGFNSYSFDKTKAQQDNNQNMKIHDKNPASHKKWIFPLTALLSIIMLIAGGLWASGIMSPKPPQPSYNSNSQIEFDISTVKNDIKAMQDLGVISFSVSAENEQKPDTIEAYISKPDNSKTMKDLELKQLFVSVENGQKYDITEAVLKPDCYEGFSLAICADQNHTKVNKPDWISEDGRIYYYRLSENECSSLYQNATPISLGPNNSILWLSQEEHFLFVQHEKTLVLLMQAVNRGAEDTSGLLKQSIQNKLNYDSNIVDGDVRWSPDGKYLFFNEKNKWYGIRMDEDDPYLIDTYTGEIFIIETDGKEKDLMQEGEFQFVLNGRFSNDGIHFFYYIRKHLTGSEWSHIIKQYNLSTDTYEEVFQTSNRIIDFCEMDSNKWIILCEVDDGRELIRLQMKDNKMIEDREKIDIPTWLQEKMYPLSKEELILVGESSVLGLTSFAFVKWDKTQEGIQWNLLPSTLSGQLINTTNSEMSNIVEEFYSDSDINDNITHLCYAPNIAIVNGTDYVIITTKMSYSSDIVDISQSPYSLCMLNTTTKTVNLLKTWNEEQSLGYDQTIYESTFLVGNNHYHLNPVKLILYNEENKN